MKQPITTYKWHEFFPRGNKMMKIESFRFVCISVFYVQQITIFKNKIKKLQNDGN